MFQYANPSLAIMSNMALRTLKGFIVAFRNRPPLIHYAFALYFHPHCRAFNCLSSPAPGNLPSIRKKTQIPGGGAFKLVCQFLSSAKRNSQFWAPNILISREIYVRNDPSSGKRLCVKIFCLDGLRRF